MSACGIVRSILFTFGEIWRICVIKTVNLPKPLASAFVPNCIGVVADRIGMYKPAISHVVVFIWSDYVIFPLFFQCANSVHFHFHFFFHRE